MYLLSNILTTHIENKGVTIRMCEILPDEVKTYLAASGEKVRPCILKPSMVDRIQNDLGLELDLTFEYWDFPDLVQKPPKPGEIFVVVNIPDSDGELPITYHLAMVVSEGDVFVFTWNDALRQRVDSGILVSKELSGVEASLYLFFTSVYTPNDDVEPLKRTLSKDSVVSQVCGLHREDIPELPKEDSFFILVDDGNPKNTKYYLLKNHPDMCASWFF